MRIWLPNVPSQRMQFSNRFQNLSYVYGGGGIVSGSVSVDHGADLSGGGYIVFGARGADSIWQLPWWSVFADVDVPASGSQRVVVSCSHPVTGDRMELGFSTTNTMYCTGTTTVVSDDTVSAGRHKCLWVYTGGVIEFWVDGVRIGTASVTLSSGSPNTLFVGCASDGSSRKLGTTIYKLDVYSYPLDEQEAFGVSAIEGWTPRSLLTDYGGSYDNGLYWDGDEDGAYDLNTQPGPVNFSTVGSVGGGVLTEPSPGVMRITTDGTSNQAIAQFTSGLDGNRLRVSCPVRGDGVAYSKCYAGSSFYWSDSAPPSATWTDRSGEQTAGSPTSSIRLYSYFNPATAGKWIEYDSSRLTARNLSCKGLNPYGSGTLAGSKFAQATDANMPWKSSDGLGVRGDGAADYAVLTATTTDTKFLHSAPCVVAGLYTPGAGGTWFDTLRNTSTRIGMGINHSGGNLLVRVGNGSGVYVVDDLLAVPMVKSAVVVVFSPPSSYEIRINGVPVSSGVPVGAVNTGPSTAQLHFMSQGGTGGTNWFDGAIRKQFCVEGALTSPEIAQLENYMMRAAR